MKAFSKFHNSWCSSLFLISSDYYVQSSLSFQPSVHLCVNMAQHYNICPSSTTSWLLAYQDINISASARCRQLDMSQCWLNVHSSVLLPLCGTVLPESLRDTLLCHCVAFKHFFSHY